MESVPGWVEHDFRAYLRCGILTHGFDAYNQRWRLNQVRIAAVTPIITAQTAG